MGNVHLVTGYAGQAHVTSADQGAFHALTLGKGQFVFDKGNKLSATIVSNNQIRIYDGDIYMQGRYIRLNEGKYVDLAIENGTQDYLRNDLIVARYTKEAGTGIEDVNLVVIKGTAVSSNPSDPSHTVGNLVENNDSLNDMLLYRVVLNGINIQELVPLFGTELLNTQDKQDKTDKLTAESALADDDYLPFYDTSASAHRKVLWSRIKTVLGNVFAPLSHKSRHATGGADALTPADIGAAAESHTHSGYAASSHNHSAANITSGTLAIARGGTGQTSITDTTYTTARYRASALVSSDTTPSTNGVINWTYK